MLYFLLFLIAIFFSFLLIRNAGSKKLFNVPWYYRVVSLDIGKVTGRTYRYKNIVGIPDAVFKHILLPIYIVGELKGRRLGYSGVHGFEQNQVMIYIGIIKKLHLGYVSGRLAYTDKVVPVKYSKSAFKHMLSRRSAAIAVMVRHNK